MDEIIDVDCSYLAQHVASYLRVSNFTGIIRDNDGDIAYFKDGKRHREDGPAIIYADRAPRSLRYRWMLDECMPTFDEWCARLNKTPEEILLLRITYGI